MTRRGEKRSGKNPRQEPAAPVQQARRGDALACWLVCGLLVLAVGLVFGQTVRHEFINFDDDQYVTQNPHVTGVVKGERLDWIFSPRHAGNWHPLTWLSHRLDFQMYGLRAGGHHLTNVVLHAAAAVGLFLLLRQLTGATWLSAWVAAVFAVHPLRAESVAWVAERKDVLSGLFFMLTLSAYAYYARRPFAWTRYLAVVVLLALGLMSKPMLVTLPCVLMLLDYWPLGRLAGLRADRRALNRIILEKIPLVALSAASCMATIEAGSVAIHEFTPNQRIANALASYVGYLGHLFYPVRLAVYYPYPEGNSLTWKVAGAGVLLAVISIIAVLRRRKQPWFLVGWLWYLGTLAPVIGLIQVGGQAMADRYTYLPQIGLLVALAWTAADMFRGQRLDPVKEQVGDCPNFRPTKMGLSPLARPLAFVFGLASVLVLTVTAWQQTSTWRNNETLWRHAVASTTRNFRAHNYLGITLSGQQRLDEAIEQFEKALAIQPHNTEANGNIGIALVQRGRLDEAIAYYRKGLAANPTCAEIHNNLGNALIRKGQFDEAIEHYREAVKLHLDRPEVYYNLGAALGQRGRLDEAIAAFRKGLELRPDDAEAYGSIGFGLFQQGKFDEAIAVTERGAEIAIAKGNSRLADALRMQAQAYRARRPGR